MKLKASTKDVLILMREAREMIWKCEPNLLPLRTIVAVCFEVLSSRALQSTEDTPDDDKGWEAG